MKHTFLDFVKLQLFEKLPPVVKTDLKGKTVVVTGANVGIGFEAAKHFARMDPGKLIIACRSKQKGEQALNEIRRETGCETAELRIVDLASFASVKSFVKTFEDNNDRLDILVENAAIVPGKQPEFTQDGWETTAQTNNLSTSLLALLLLPRMIDTAKKYNTTPRLVVVASSVHYWTQFDESLVNSPNFFRSFAHKDVFSGSLGERYLDTKLLNVFFARALNDRLKRSPIIVDSVCPGYCYSSLRKDFSGLQAWIDRLMEICLARTTEQGSRQLVWAAVGGTGNEDELRGAFIASTEVTEPSDFVISEKGQHAQDKIWDDLIVELTKVDPEVQNIVQKYLA
ncbi:short-chain dehydrogenase [Agrocybe pediades]|nr:short-chain dehydrogenase [Agrocybe pediades]